MAKSLYTPMQLASMRRHNTLGRFTGSDVVVDPMQLAADRAIPVSRRNGTPTTGAADRKHGLGKLWAGAADRTHDQAARTANRRKGAPGFVTGKRAEYIGMGDSYDIGRNARAFVTIDEKVIHADGWESAAMADRNERPAFAAGTNTRSSRVGVSLSTVGKVAAPAGTHSADLVPKNAQLPRVPRLVVTVKRDADQVSAYGVDTVGVHTGADADENKEWGTSIADRRKAAKAASQPGTFGYRG